MGEVTSGFEKIIIVTFFVTVICYNLYKIIENLVIINFNKVRSSKK